MTKLHLIRQDTENPAFSLKVKIKGHRLTTSFRAEEFLSSNLIPGAIYRASTESVGKGNEVLSQLLPGISNSGGFRARRAEDGDPQIVVLYSTGAEGEWPDSLDSDGETFTYYGDNRKPGNEIHSTSRGGNRLLRKWFDSLSAGAQETVPLVLGFRKFDLAGGSDVEFIGVLVPGAKNHDPNEVLTVERRQHPTGDFENYKAQFTVLDTGAVDGEFVRRSIIERSVNWSDPRVPQSLQQWRQGVTFDTAKKQESGADRLQSNKLDDEQKRSSFFASLRRSPRGSAQPFDLSEISARPGLEVLRTYRSIALTPWHALGEFVDNSVTSFWERILDEPDDVRFDRLTVDITWDSVSEVLTITDDAAGIPETQSGWGRALKTGVSNPNPRGLSVHGVGMKAAGLWWAPVIKIKSKHVDAADEISAIFDLDEMIRTDRTDIDLVKSPAPDPGAHGTTVTLEGLNYGRGYPTGMQLGKVRTYLSSMYRSFLRGDDEFLHPRTGKAWLTLNVYGQTLAYEDPELLMKPFWPNDQGPDENSENVTWRKNYVLSIPTSRGKAGAPGSIRVAGWMGILAKMEKGKAGLFLTFRGKGVSGVEQGASDGNAYKPGRIFGADQGQRARRLVGEFEVSEFGKSLTTDAVNWSPEEEEVFVDILLEAIKSSEFPLYQMANNFRISDKSELTAADEKRIKRGLEDATQDAGAVVKRAGYDLPAENGPEVPDTELDQTAGGSTIVADSSFELSDGRTAKVIAVLDRGGRWLSIFPGDPVEIKVNYGHPFVSRYWQSTLASLPIVHFAIAIAEAELRDEQFREAGARAHINNWLLEVAKRDFDMLRIEDHED
jgi:hypothetical protein